jgi:hypothetical protein
MAFDMAATTFRKWCKLTPVRDLKAHTSYRMTAVGRMAQVAPGGQLEHASLTESSYSLTANTFGRILGIDRKDIINDDLSVLATVPAALGRMSAISLERAVYTELLANTGSFFHSNNANLLTGGGSVLALAGLDDAMEVFDELKDANGDPVMIPPAVLLVPSALHATARNLMNSQAVVATTTANTPLPDGNPWRGSLEVVRSAYLGATVGLTGNSDTAWYVLAGPGDFSIMQVGFLDGRQAPMVESAELDFDRLGIAMRVVHDWGVAFLEPKGGIKSAGA